MILRSEPLAERPGAATVRSFVTFPDHADIVPVRARRLIPFQCVILFESGLLAHFVTQRRSIPHADEFLDLEPVLARMARDFWPAGYATQVAEDEYELNLELKDDPFQTEGDWVVEPHLSAALANVTVLARHGSPTEARAKLADDAHARLNQALDALLDGLDPEIIPCVTGADRRWRPSHYNYFAAGTPDLRRNRLQGRVTAPIAYRYFTDHAPPKPLIWSLTLAIDRGHSCIALLRERAGMTPAIAKAVLDCPLEIAIRPWGWDLERIGRCVAPIKPAFFPKTADAWRGLHEVTRVLTRSLHMSEGSPELANWLNDAARQGFRLWDDEHQRELGIHIVREMVDAVTGVAMAGHPAGEELTTKVRKAVVGAVVRKRLPNALAAARAWQAAFEREQQRMVNDKVHSSGIKWPVPCPEYRNESRLIQPLATPEDLYIEGRTMQHCVASYARTCAMGDVSIWSVRTSAGERCTTLAIHFLDAEGSMVEVEQHFGFRNCAADEVSHSAARELCLFLSEKAEELKDYHAWRLKPKPSVRFNSQGLPVARIQAAAVQAAVPELLAAGRSGL